MANHEVMRKGKMVLTIGDLTEERVDMIDEVDKFTGIDEVIFIFLNSAEVYEKVIMRSKSDILRSKYSPK